MITDLANCNLLVDEIYGGGRHGNAKDDPLPKLLGVDSGAGFRHLGKRPHVNTLKMLVLKTSFSDTNWPDSIDTENGLFTYYGDRHSPGELHDTPRQGNAILRNLFDASHSSDTTDHFPPIFLFSNAGQYRDLRFLGLAVPGAEGLNQDEDLVAVWRTSKEGIRFQNYRAEFTILNISTVSREWIADIQKGEAVDSPHAPKVWLDWVKGRKSTALKSTPSVTVRSQAEQTPSTSEQLEIIQKIHNKYQSNPTDFETCAMEIARLFMPAIQSWEITRPWRDGGRDAIGTYRIGTGAGHIDVEFALEAKCYKIKNGVGVRQLSRLISRLRHRQFGILVTTSYLSKQAYDELIDDNHPVVVISAVDIASKLQERFGSIRSISQWLDRI